MARHRSHSVACKRQVAQECLNILVDGVAVGMTYADAYRPDLEAACIGEGCHAFDLTLAYRRAGSVVTVRCSADDAVLGTARVGADFDAAA